MTELRIYHGAVAVVTGAASGIGRALSGDLASRGATVIVADLQDELAQEVVAEIKDGGGTAEAHHLDVTDAEAFDALIADVVARHGRIDFLFNNAGIVYISHFRRMTLAEHRRLVDVNIGGVLNGICAVFDRMREQGFGHIVNTASISAFLAAPLFATYGGTKHAVLGISKNLAIECEYENTGVRVSAICPGLIRTAMLEGGRFGGMNVDIADQKGSDRALLAPDELARRSLDQVARNKRVIVVPGYWRLLWILTTLFPFLERLGARQLMNKRVMIERGGGS